MPFNPQLGIAEETTFGTIATPTRFYEYGNASIQQAIERIEYLGLRPNRKVLGTTNSVPGKVSVGGAIEMPVMNKGMALWWKHILGQIATSTPTGGTTARDHKATVGTLDGKSLTIQQGVPPTSGAAQAFTWAGCKVNEWELTWDTDSQLMLNVTVDGISESTATGLASASYPSGLEPFAYTKGVLTVAGSSFDISQFSLSGNNSLATERYFIRSTTPASKKEQLEGGGIREYTGTLTCEFTDLTAYNRFVNHTTASVVLTATGSIIEGALNYTVEVTLPDVRFDGETPNVTGFEIVEQSLPFKVLDGANADGPVIVRTRNSDTAP